MMKSTHGTPNEAAIDEMVAVERLALCDLLEQLDPDEWSVRSLCEQWGVRDVVAHLTLATHETIGAMIVGMVKARGNFDRMNTNAAIEQSRAFDPPGLIQQLRDTARSTQRNPMSSQADQLVDILVHTQDIARPLGRNVVADPKHVVPALDHAVGSRWYGGRKRFSEVRLIATDADWTAGAGSLDVEGTAGGLLLVATGRNDALVELTGPGVDALA